MRRPRIESVWRIFIKKMVVEPKHRHGDKTLITGAQNRQEAGQTGDKQTGRCAEKSATRIKLLSVKEYQDTSVTTVTEQMKRLC